MKLTHQKVAVKTLPVECLDTHWTWNLFFHSSDCCHCSLSLEPSKLTHTELCTKQFMFKIPAFLFKLFLKKRPFLFKKKSYFKRTFKVIQFCYLVNFIIHLQWRILQREEKIPWEGESKLSTRSRCCIAATTIYPSISGLNYRVPSPPGGCCCSVSLQPPRDLQVNDSGRS